MVDWSLSFAACWLACFHVGQTWGYYCASDKCDFDEYCCGHNICCTSYNVWQMWYFWLGLVLFLLLLAACFGFWRYRYQQALTFTSVNNPYSRVDSTTTVTLSGHYPRQAKPQSTPDSSSDDEPMMHRPTPTSFNLSATVGTQSFAGGPTFSHATVPYASRAGSLAIGSTVAAGSSDHLPSHASMRSGYM